MKISKFVLPAAVICGVLLSSSVKAKSWTDWLLGRNSEPVVVNEVPVVEGFVDRAGMEPVSVGPMEFPETSGLYDTEAMDKELEAKLEALDRLESVELQRVRAKEILDEELIATDELIEAETKKESPDFHTLDHKLVSFSELGEIFKDENKLSEEELGVHKKQAKNLKERIDGLKKQHKHV